MAVIAVASVLLGVWWFVESVRVRETAPALAHRLRTAASTQTPMAVVGSAAASTSAAPVPASHVEGAVEVCGIGWIKRPEDEAQARALVARSGVEPARERILATLRADPSEFARATVLLLAMMSNDDPGVFARIGLVADARDDARDQLARLAASTTDASVYALAYKACSRAPGQGACQLVTAEQWARLDPDNAAPWLFMLSTATDRNDLAAQSEALHRIAMARYQRLGFFATAGVVLGAAPIDDGTQLAAWELVTRVIGFEVAIAQPGLSPLVNLCKGSHLADANRAQTCGAIAETMTERSDTLLDRMIGTSIGKNAGWPAERHERLRGENTAYLKAMLPADPLAQGLDCGELRREMAQVRRHAAVGETGALREWVRQSGKSPEAFVQEERERQQRSERARQEAAASAAAASAGR